MLQGYGQKQGPQIGEKQKPASLGAKPDKRQRSLFMSE
jgi:hypothetical protein